jgi:steroid delta-isomerase-like uncharacterized protein
MSTDASHDLNARTTARLAMVEEHIAHENRHDLEGIMSTFGDHAQYSDAPWGERHVGRPAVEHYYRDLLTALPDLTIQVQERIVADDAIVLEVMIAGTHAGPWRGLPATGRGVRFPVCAIYRFTPSGKLASESIYYDRAGVLGQVGLYHEPVGLIGRALTGVTHPVTLARAYMRKLFGRSAPNTPQPPTRRGDWA